MERNPYAINVESNPYQIELAGHEHGKVSDDSGNGSLGKNEYASTSYRAHMPTRASISRKGKELMKGVQNRGGCRLAICLLGVALCWLASFQVASTFVEIIFTTSKGGPQVQQSWEEFGAQINLERERNVECVNNSLGTCLTVLQSQFESMGFDVDVVALQNSYLVANATAYQQKCAGLQADKIKSIQIFKLAASKANKEFIYNTSCSQQDRTNLNQLYTDPTMTANQATTATSQYGNSNQVTWAQAFESMQARVAYDKNYWTNQTSFLKKWYEDQDLGISLNAPKLPDFSASFGGFDADMGQYWACATLSNTPPCPVAGGLRASANATLASFQSKYSELQAKIERQRNESQAFADKAKAKAAAFNSYATNVGNKLQDLKATVNSLDCGQPCDDVLSKFPGASGVSLPADLDVRGITIPPLPTVNFDSIMTKLGLNYSGSTADIKAKLNTMQAQVTSTVTNWDDQIDFNIKNQFTWNASFGFDVGYNPPPVKIDTANVTNLTNAYLAATNGQLSDVAAKLSPGGGSGGNKTDEVLRNLKLGANSISTTAYTYAMLGGSFDLDLWFFSMNWFRFFLYFLDYAWRIWYSGRIFIRYWYGAAGTMPPIDIRSYRTTKATPLNVRVARYATHPFVLFGGAMVVAILVVSVIIGIYIPLLDSYIQGCVKSDSLGKSTFLSQNVYAAAFNAAVLEGNRDLSTGLNDYDTSRANLCGTKQQDARDAFANQQYQLKIVRDNMLSVTDLLYKMEFCTLRATWSILAPYDFNYYTDVPNERAYAHIPCSVAAFDALGTLEPPPINCTNLPTCGTECGVDTNVVQGVSHRASCETEWYLHSTILQGVCTVVVFIFWNVCRTLLLDGLVRIYWKHLVRGTGLNFYATCNNQGQIDTDTEDQLVVAIKESDASYRRMGIIYIVMSFLLNIPYIVFCVLLNIDITYPY